MKWYKANNEQGIFKWRFIMKVYMNVYKQNNDKIISTVLYLKNVI